MRKPISTFFCILLAVALLFSCTSCAIQISASELSEGYKRSVSDTGEVTSEFQNAMAKFSMTLFQGLITEDSENDAVSPLSAILCLAMLLNGADGNTRAQMEEAFGMDTDTLNRCLYAYTSSLYTAEDCKVNIADSIWFRDDKGVLQVKESFLQTNADWYDAQIYAAPFDQSTVKDINAWCEKQTDGMIKEMLKSIDPDSVMYLINALTFDAKWAKKYEKGDISDRQFTNYDGTKATVPMLSSDESTYLSADGVTGFAKDYIGGKYSFVALLPDEGTDIYQYIRALDGDAWLSLWNARSRIGVDVKMPEFSYDTHMTLNDTLSAMGMRDMFDGGTANFANLGTSGYGNIYCSSVQQKVFVQVDRNGTKAAALTWADMKANSADPSERKRVILDRPFVFAIVDNATGLPLFVGAVTYLK